MMKVLICGDREWQDSKTIADRIKHLPPGTKVIHGACRGVDRIAGNAAFNLGLGVVQYPAQWKKYGRAAGPIRNKRMLDEKPDLVIVFHTNLARSKGTKNMMTLAVDAGIPIEIIGGG